jgi:hypothetical protein
MHKLKSQNIASILIILFVIISNSHHAAAQSSLFNIPTTDVMPTGETYLEADFDTHLTGYQRGGFQGFGAMVVYGLKKRMEVGINVNYAKTGEPNQPIELQPNAKFQLYNSESKGIAVAVGTVLYLPVTKRRGIDSFGTVYVTVSKIFRGSYGPRLTTGGYALIGRDKETGNRKGVLLGYEQPLRKGISFIADWNTGKNRFGYAAAGLGFTFSKRNFLYTAYYFGNEGRGNNSLGVYYGFTF